MPQPRPGIWDARARNPQRIHYIVNCKEVLSAESENIRQILIIPRRYVTYGSNIKQ